MFQSEQLTRAVQVGAELQNQLKKCFPKEAVTQAAQSKFQVVAKKINVQKRLFVFKII